MLDQLVLSCQSQNAIAAISCSCVPCGTVGLDFTALLKRVAARFPSQQAFAEALDMSTARLNRALNKSDYPFNALNCLRLARLSGESASEILRAANKGEVADLIESLYGTPTSTAPDERELLERFRAMKQPAKTKLLEFVREIQPPAIEDRRERGDVKARRPFRTATRR